jgi:hypothetical protein
MPATMPKPKTYTPDEIAEVLDRHPESIRRNLREGDLHGFKVGGAWVVTPDALRDWLGDEAFGVFFAEASTGDGAA